MAEYKLRQAPQYKYECFQLPARGNFNTDPFFRWAEENNFDNWESARDETMDIELSNGDLICANPSDWIALNEDGEPSVYNPQEFQDTFFK